VKRAILVTTHYHLPRSLFLCDRIGIEVIGVYPDERDLALSEVVWRHLREIGAMWNALFDLVQQ
jgi:vancomycin permeability regulator SanA